MGGSGTGDPDPDPPEPRVELPSRSSVEKLEPAVCAVKSNSNRRVNRPVLPARPPKSSVWSPK